MAATKIAIIREEKWPQDRRTPITPTQADAIMKAYPNVEVVCQSSDLRCFSDEEYRKEGIAVLDDVSSCDVFLGVKEVPAESLVDGKTYMFFSHTIKKQSYNQKLLKNIVEKKIRLIDYECLTDEKGLRIIAFGKWAGIVGAYNALWTYGKKYNAFSLKRAYQCRDLDKLFDELKNLNLPPVKILITGNGRVAKGALEVMEAALIKKVDPEQYLFQQFDEPVYAQIDADVYNKRKNGDAFSFDHFFQNPIDYKSNFKTFYKTTDILIMAAFWDPAAPRLFEVDDLKDESFKIRLIADITCDINGSVPTTIKPTTMQEPVYDIDRANFSEKAPFSHEDNLTVMAIDNLPNELPRDASVSFGEQLVQYVLPDLLDSDELPTIKNATITADGDLTPKFEYLRDYLLGKS